MSKITFSRKRQFGINMYFANETPKFSVIFADNKYRIRIWENGEWHYPYWSEVQLGFNTLSDVADWLSNHDWESATKTNIEVDSEHAEAKDIEFKAAMDMLGFERKLDYRYSENDPPTYELSVTSPSGDSIDVRVIKYDDEYHTTYWVNYKRIPESSKPADTFNVSKLVNNIEKMLSKYDYQIIESSYVVDSAARKKIMAAINTRNLVDNMVRVKSSNVWSYGMNMKNYNDKTGDLLVQFKDNNGGPGDIYIYYDVPPKIYRKWITTPSKGSYFWRYIRNFFKYSKLTGDKKGKLANAIN